MDILNISTQWARDEIFSSKFFVVIAIIFIAVAIGFWQLGKSELAKSFVIPMLVCGALIMIIGIGLIYNNTARLRMFEEEYNRDRVEFVESELSRTASTIVQTKTIIYLWIPILIIIAALGLILLDSPRYRAFFITVIAMMLVLMFVDSNSCSRIVSYRALFESIDIGLL